MGNQKLKRMRDPERKATEVHPYVVVKDDVSVQVDTIPQADLSQTQVDLDPEQIKGDGTPLENLRKTGCTQAKKSNCIIALLTTLIVLCTGSEVVKFTQAEAEPIIVYLP